MKKITAIEIVILLIAGLVPLLWLNPAPNIVIANGDSFALYLNPQKTLHTAPFLWSENNLGTPNLEGALLIYQYFGFFLSSFGLSPGAVEIIFQILFLMGAGFSMFYFTRVVYPDHELAPLVAGIFYMFNFFVLASRLNVGFLWTYTFLPLLLALFIRAVDSAYQQQGNSNKRIIIFSLAAMVGFSFAAINPANIVLMLLALLVVTVYELVKYRRNLKPFLGSFAKIALISIPLSLWWMLPLLNVYFLSPQILNSQVNVWDWSWTQTRSSFLNIFWFNGFWEWNADFVPYFNAYSNPILTILVFVPFALAGAALLFKSKKSAFNAYIMLSILAFIFLAKGLHSPFSEVNAALYEHVPLMNMFREPTTKFTMLIVAFSAPLIGYAAANLANLHIRGHRRVLKFAVPIVLAAVFVTASFPMITNPLEAKTALMPYSSYNQIPDYWTEAASWINNQDGDYKVLFCPLDDFYLIPYNWGYYGVEQLLFRLFEKPIVSTDYLSSYVLKPGTVSTLKGLTYSISNGSGSDFKVYLDLLNIKYVFQRNDVNTTDANMLPPEQMRAFLSSQPYLHLVKTFGQIDIYEYSDAKPSVYAFPQTLLEQSRIEIETVNTTQQQWAFNSTQDAQAWANSTASYNKGGAVAVGEDNGLLKARLWDIPPEWNNTLWGMKSIWQNISSPLIPVTYGINYQIKVDFRAETFHQLYIRVIEYSDVPTYYISNTTRTETYEGNLSWGKAELEYTPSSMSIHNAQISICNYGNDSLAMPTLKDVWIDNVTVIAQTPRLYSEKEDQLFNQPSVSVSQYQIVSPMQTVLTVNASQPFVVATSQNLDKFWVANVNGQQMQPTPLYIGITGLIINQTGTFDITLSYQPQVWFNYFLALSGGTAVLCCLLLVYPVLRRKKTKVDKPQSNSG